jgi:hypothetical protein
MDPVKRRPGICQLGFSGHPGFLYFTFHKVFLIWPRVDCYFLRLPVVDTSYHCQLMYAACVGQISSVHVLTDLPPPSIILLTTYDVKPVENSHNREIPIQCS